ncbi:MAG TPA: AAA family ATPase [Candidatus Saccharimonadales bacterium]|nr:AAA family ATPase [Candidatus Saccharimonadales bacterium]
MRAYLILGPAGSGKTTVGRELKRRGFHVTDLDFVDRLIDWTDLRSSRQIAKVPEHPYQHDWALSHRRVWDTDKMKELLAEVGNEIAFFCGGAENDRDFFGSFERCFGLHVDDETLTKRLRQRNPNRWSDGSKELQKLLAWNQRFQEFCRRHRVILIDSSPQPEAVADTVLNYIQE